MSGPMWERLVWLSVAGAAGTLARYALTHAVHRFCGSGFAWGTLVVNALGCFLFGLVWSLAEERLLPGSHARLAALTGFMGAFTTFSTFAFETVDHLRASEWFLASANVGLQTIFGLGLVLLGLLCGRAV